MNVTIRVSEERMRLREMTREDALDADFYACLAALSPSPPLDPERATRIFLDREDTLTLVAVQDERIVGTATLFMEQKFLRGGARVGHIEDVAVRSEYQRQGIGRALVNALVEAAQQSIGCYKVILDCREDLVGFYARLGFVATSHGMRKDLL